MSVVPPSPLKNPAAAPAVRVMVVDDSAVIRGLITRALETDPGIHVVTSANNGERAIDLLRTTPVDVVILDIEMPVMDGITAIPKLKEIDPGVQIVMASTLTQKNAEISLKALALGATDYIPKPSSREIAGADEFQHDLIEKVKTFGAMARRKGVRQVAPGAQGAIVRLPPPPPAPEKKPVVLRPMPTGKAAIIAIGSSTGGPQALFDVVKAMGPDLPQPIVITQHMPPAFTTILADHITKQCGVACAEAVEGEVLKSGHYYVAPGDFHMLIAKKSEGPTVHLTKDPPENFCRPAVDPMLRSLVETYGGHIFVAILTGMGADGCKGSDAVVQAGGAVIAQDEATSIVWGMPGAVANAGLCSAVLPLSEIGASVRQYAMRGRV
ncbi:MAG: chemotaxis response regulator protein-glutamate methylesterase [Alphaproteobacteria bacterium]|nr:chemotaxis response regulator protein-glutamate methylesterase [Alphaproteobacteria bacterium]